jgi:hypothetical protein
VPPELLLDIKKMAEYESSKEEFLREIFDLFNADRTSILYGKLSATKKQKGHITRSVFNTAVGPLNKVFGSKLPGEIYEIYNSYLVAFNESIFIPHEIEDKLVNATIFKALAGFFPVVTSKVQDRFGGIYTVDNYYELLLPVGKKIKVAKFNNVTNAYKPIVEHLEESLKTEFTL